MASQNVDTADIAQLQAQIEQLQAQLENAEIRLREMGIADPITGLFSYRYFLGRIMEEVARADRFGLEVGCVMIGLDQPSFEGILEIARLLKETCRTYDVPARWGQNELAIVMPATDEEGAQTFAERFRIIVEETFREHPTLAGLTVSVGFATYPKAGIEEARQLLESVNQAMDLAQQAGGNKTVARQ